ncbi:MAG TPA: hypothetical protein V6C58_12710 [Allocoleopsis sp.]
MTEQHNEALIREIHSELKSLTQKFESAFIKDDSGEPDYFGHRLYHKKKQEEENTNKEVKTHVKGEISTWAIILIITIFGSSILQAFTQHLIKVMGGQ